MATIHDVAQAVGVSVSTVSRILNCSGTHRYAEATREAVFAAAQRLGYAPSLVAQALVRGRTNLVGVATDLPSDPVYAQMIDEAYQIARCFGFHLILSPREEASDVGLRRLLQGRQIDIAVWTGWSPAFVDSLWESRSASHQLVVAAGPKPEHPPTHTLIAYFDELKAICLGMEHLHRLGHRRVAFLAGGSSLSYKRDCFEAEAARLGIDALVIPTVGEERVKHLYEGAEMGRQALKARPRPTALYARNDVFAIGALHAIQEAGVRVPDDISVVGVADIPWAAFSSPPLTTVHTPFVECVDAVLTAALSHVTRESSEPLEPGAMEIEPRLIIRRTTGPARGGESR